MFLKDEIQYRMAGLRLFQLCKTENYAMEVKYFINLSTGLNSMSLPTSAQGWQGSVPNTFSFVLYTENIFFVQNCDILDFVHK